jgi:hypothetical protein
MTALLSIEQSQEISDFLRHAYSKSIGLAPEQRRQVLEICLAYRLRDIKKPQLSQVLRQLRGYISGSPEVAVEEPFDLHHRDLLLNLISRFGGADAALDSTAGPEEISTKAEQILDKLENSLKSIARRVTSREMPLLEALHNVENMFEANDQAMEQAAQESFDRLLNALDPDKVQEKVEKKMLSTPTGYKASLYDSLSEKFQQLKIYHDKGRLVRDYRAIFKKYLKQNLAGK